MSDQGEPLEEEMMNQLENDSIRDFASAVNNIGRFFETPHIELYRHPPVVIET